MSLKNPLVTRTPKLFEGPEDDFQHPAPPEVVSPETPLILRASMLGGCERAYSYFLLGYTPQPFSAKTELIFDIGSALEPVIIQHAGYDLKRHWYADQIKAIYQIEPDLLVRGHPDGEDSFNTILEAKTMNSFAWNACKDQGIQEKYPQYCCQGAIYSAALSKRGVIFLMLNLDRREIMKIDGEFPRLTTQELRPFLDLSTEKALRIKKAYQERKLLPKPKNLPSWACQSQYCQWWDCYSNSAKKAVGRKIGARKKAKKEKHGNH